MKFFTNGITLISENHYKTLKEHGYGKSYRPAKIEEIGEKFHLEEVKDNPKKTKTKKKEVEKLAPDQNSEKAQLDKA